MTAWPTSPSAVSSLHRSAQLRRAGLEFFEEADVLNRDDSLIREGLEQGNLAVRERPGVRGASRSSTQPPDPHEAAGRHDAPVTQALERGHLGRGTSPDSTSVMKRGASAVMPGRGRRYPPSRVVARGPAPAPDGFVLVTPPSAVVTHEMREEPGEPAQQPDRTADDRVEDRLDVGRRAADDLQDLARRRLLLEGLRHLRVCLLTCSSVNRRTFSTAMTAWSAKVWSRAICLSEKGRSSAREMTIVPIGPAVAQQGHHQEGTEARLHDRAEVVLRVLRDVDVDDGARQGSPGP